MGAIELIDGEWYWIQVGSEWVVALCEYGEFWNYKGDHTHKPCFIRGPIPRPDAGRLQ